jgi:diaminopimelate epimerase
MLIQFTKMQATGNDFVVIDNLDGHLNIDQMIAITPRLCDRRLGVGADGTLFLCPSNDYDFQMVYRNADGSDAGMCGNGGRAIALFASMLGLGSSLQFSVHDAVYEADIAGNMVKLAFKSLECRPTSVPDPDLSLFTIFSGTDHLVVITTEELIDQFDTLRSIGKRLRYDERFSPRGTNVNFCRFSGENNAIMRTYERGVEDLTLACGTGAIATAIVNHFTSESSDKQIHTSSTIQCLGGTLTVGFDWNDISETYEQITLQGLAHAVFEGTIDIPV